MVKSVAEKARRAQQSEQVRAVRARFAMALSLGYTNKEAARIANGSGPIEKPAATADVPAAPQVEMVPVRESVVSISGDAKPKPDQQPQPTSTIPLRDIPPNWQDLPWVQLKRLAAELSGQSIVSRAKAIEAVEAALKTKT